VLESTAAALEELATVAALAVALPEALVAVRLAGGALAAEALAFADVALAGAAFADDLEPAPWKKLPDEDFLAGNLPGSARASTKSSSDPRRAGTAATCATGRTTGRRRTSEERVELNFMIG
jgi:hypothetical protein